MMKSPPQSLESYFNAIKDQSKVVNTQQTMNPQQNPANLELMKLKQLQSKRAEFQHQISLIENQLMKVQGALEVLSNIGIRPTI